MKKPTLDNGKFKFTMENLHCKMEINIIQRKIDIEQ